MTVEVHPSVKTHVAFKYRGKLPEIGNPVYVRVPGVIADVDWSTEFPTLYIKVEGDAYVNDDDQIEVSAELKNTELRAPEIHAGQAYKRDGRVYMVIREKPLSMGGELAVVDSLTGHKVSVSTLTGAELVLDIDPTDN